MWVCGMLMRNLILTYWEGRWEGNTILDAKKAGKNWADTKKLEGCHWWRNYRMKHEYKHKLLGVKV